LTASPNKLYPVDIARPQRKKAATQEHLEKGLGKGNGDGGMQIQLRKMEAAAQDRVEWSQVVCGLCSTNETSHLSDA